MLDRLDSCYIHVHYTLHITHYIHDSNVIIVGGHSSNCNAITPAYLSLDGSILYAYHHYVSSL